MTTSRHSFLTGLRYSFCIVVSSFLFVLFVLQPGVVSAATLPESVDSPDTEVDFRTAIETSERLQKSDRRAVLAEETNRIAQPFLFTRTSAERLNTQTITGVWGEFNPFRQPLALRSVSTWYLKVDEPPLRIRIRAQKYLTDEPPLLDWALYDDLDREVAQGEYDEPLTETVRELATDVPLTEAGLYRLQVNAPRSVRYDLETDATLEGLGNGIELDDSTKPLDLYFEPQPGSFRLEVMTYHQSGVGQIVTLNNALNSQVATVRIEEPGTPYVLTYDVSEDQPESIRLWRVGIPRQDILINSPQVDVWVLNQPNAEPLEPLLRLLRPRSLSKAGLPGDTIPFLLRLDNDHQELRHYVIALPRPKPSDPAASLIDLDDDLQVAASLPRGVTTNILLPIPVAADALVGATAELIAGVYEINESELESIPPIESLGTPLARSRLVVLATEPAPIAWDRPALLFDERDVAERFENAPEDELPILEAIRNQLIANANGVLADPVLIHEWEGAFPHFYVCDGIGDGNDDPNDGDGSQLVFEPERPYEHICPTDGRIYRGSPYNEAWIGFYHELNSRRIRSLGRGYAVTGDERYARRAIEMANRYAELYLSFPLRDPSGGEDERASRLTGFTLTEATWTLNLLEGLTAVWRSPELTDAKRVNIEYNLLRPLAENMTRYDVGVNNIQGWHTGIRGLLGLLLNDAEIIEDSLHGSRGLDRILAEGLLPDGVWFEGSPTYHYYGLRPVSLLGFAAERLGANPWPQRLDDAFFGPTHLLLPDNRYPRFNDSDRGSLRSVADLYELAAGRSDDLAYDAILARIYDWESVTRNEPWVLLMGGARQSVSPDDALSQDLSELGTVVLRSMQTVHAEDAGSSFPDETAAYMDYGPQGGTHGHDDKLNLVLYAQNRELLTDFGYGGNARGTDATWYARTLGHNTILTGERDQSEAGDVPNDLLKFKAGSNYSNEDESFPTEGPLRIAQAAAQSGIYSDGANVVRTVLSPGDYWLVIDKIANALSPIDIVWHTPGFLYLEQPERFGERPAPVSWEDIPWGYQHLLPPRFLAGPDFQNYQPVAFPYALNSPDATEENLPVRIRAENYLKLSDTCDDLLPWFGNLTLSDNCTQGDAAFRWVVIPRIGSTIGKDLTHPLVDLSQVSRVSFDVCVEGALPSSFGLIIQDPGRLDGCWYDLTRFLQPNWQSVEVDLRNPDAVLGSDDNRKQLIFYHRGPDEGEGASFIHIDNIQAEGADGPEQQVTAGVAISANLESARDIILADGPGEGAGRDIPVILNRTESSTTRCVSLLEGYTGEPRLILESANESAARVVAGDYVDEWRFESGSWGWGRTWVEGDFLRFILELTGLVDYQNSYIGVSGSQPLNLYVKTISESNERLRIYYAAGSGAPFTMILKISDDIGGGEVYHSEVEGVGPIAWSVNESGELVLPDLPTGAHHVSIWQGAETTVTDWILNR